MNKFHVADRAIVAGVAVVLALGVVAIAVAASSGGNEGKRYAVASVTAPGDGASSPGAAPDASPAGRAIEAPSATAAAAGDTPAYTGPAYPFESRGEDPAPLPSPGWEDGSVSGDGSSNVVAPVGPGSDEPRSYPSAKPTPGDGGSTSSPTYPAPDAPVSSEDPPVAVPDPVMPPNSEVEPAPIDGVSDVRVMESYPPQYALTVHAGLPSGCASPFTHEVARDGNVIDVTVLNAVEQADACTAIYGMYDVNVALGSDFTPGETYTVRVNDEAEVTFVAQ